MEQAVGDVSSKAEILGELGNAVQTRAKNGKRRHLIPIYRNDFIHRPDDFHTLRYCLSD
jgi:hypothetical protein